MIWAVLMAIFYVSALILMAAGHEYDKTDQKSRGALLWGLAALSGVVPCGIIAFHIQGSDGKTFFGVVAALFVLAGVFFIWHSQKLKNGTKKPK